jgi:hypothetical protein
VDYFYCSLAMFNWGRVVAAHGTIQIVNVLNRAPIYDAPNYSSVVRIRTRSLQFPGVSYLELNLCSV